MFLGELMPTVQTNLTFAGEDKQTLKWEFIIYK